MAIDYQVKLDAGTLLMGASAVIVALALIGTAKTKPGPDEPGYNPNTDEFTFWSLFQPYTKFQKPPDVSWWDFIWSGWG